MNNYGIRFADEFKSSRRDTAIIHYSLFILH